MVCSLLNVVRCRLGRPSFRLRRATMQIDHRRKKITKKTIQFDSFKCSIHAISTI